jgi:hypothetical protein
MSDQPIFGFRKGFPSFRNGRHDTPEQDRV